MPDLSREDIREIIWSELNRTLSTVLTGISANAADIDGVGPVEDVGNLVPGLPTIQQRAACYPWGVSSKAPTGTTQIVAKGGNHPLNRFIISHYDPKRPTIGSGETVLYNAYGQQVRLENGAIKLGSTASAENIVLGQKLKTMLQTFMTAFFGLAVDVEEICNTVSMLAGILATASGLSPIQIAQCLAAVNLAIDNANDAFVQGQTVQTAQSDFVDNDDILSDESFARKGP